MTKIEKGILGKSLRLHGSGLSVKCWVSRGKMEKAPGWGGIFWDGRVFSRLEGASGKKIVRQASC